MQLGLLKISFTEDKIEQAGQRSGENKENLLVKRPVLIAACEKENIIEYFESHFGNGRQVFSLLLLIVGQRSEQPFYGGCLENKGDKNVLLLRVVDELAKQVLEILSSEHAVAVG